MSGAPRTLRRCAEVVDAASEEIADVRAKQKSLLWRGALKRDQHVGNVFMHVVVRRGESVLWRIDLVW